MEGHEIDEKGGGYFGQLDRRAFLGGLGGLAAALGLVGCGQQAGGGGSGGSVTSKPGHGNGQYVEVSMLNSLPYFVDHKLGMEFAGKWLGVKTRFEGPANLDLNGMIATLDSFIAQNVSGLIVVGFDPALAPSINRALEHGIPTVTVDSDVPNSKRLSFLGTGNYQAGVLGANTLVKLVGGAGKVAIVTRTGQNNLEQRVAGYKDTLTKAGVEVSSVLNDDSDSTKAAAAVSAELRRVPDLAGIACVEAAGGVGAATAVHEAGKVGKVKIVSMDRDPETLAKVQAGDIQASVAQKTALMSLLGTLLCHAFQTLSIAITNNNQAAGVTQFPSLVDTGVDIVTKDNVKYWQRKGQ